MASVNVEITGDARKLEQTFDKINQGQKKVEDGFDNVAQSGKDSARKIDEGFSKSGETGKEAARKIKEELVHVGEAGKGSARQIEAGFEKAGASGKDAARKVNQEYAQVGETGRDSARQIESANEAAANKGAASYNRILTELRRQGPEGRTAARAIEGHLQEAGKAGRRSMGDVVAELRELDPVAADVASRSETAFGKFADGAVTKIAAIGAAYVGVETIIQSVDGYLQKQEQRIEASGDAQGPLAAAQASAIKAMTAYTPEQRDFLLNVAPEQIMRGSGVKDPNVITTAIGLASEGTPEQVVAAVTAAAKANFLEPQEIPGASAAAVSVMRKTGLEDPRAAIALMDTINSQSALAESRDLNTNLPVAIGAIATVRDQDPVEAARQIGAIWAAGSMAKQDTSGAETTTFVNELTSRMFKFFGDLDATRIDAQSRLESLNKTVVTGERQQVRDQAERDQLASFLAATEGSFNPERLKLDRSQADAYQQHQRQRLRSQETIERVDQREALGTATESDLFERKAAREFLADTTGFWDAQRAAAQTKLEQIEHRLSTSSSLEKERRDRDQQVALLAELETMQDPKTIAGRIEALQSNPAMRLAFVGDGFGSGNFAVFLDELLTDGSQTDEAVQATLNVIKADPEHYERDVTEKRSATSQLRNTTAVERVDAQLSTGTVFNDEASTLSSVRKIAANTMAATNPGGIMGWIDDVASARIRRGSLPGSTAAEEGVSAIQQMQHRLAMIAMDGIDASERQSAEDLTVAIEEISTLIGGQAERGDLSRKSLESAAAQAQTAAQVSRSWALDGRAGEAGDVLRKNTEVLERLAGLLQSQLDAQQKQLSAQQQTAENTRPRPQRADPAETIRASAASADARAPR